MNRKSYKKSGADLNSAVRALHDDLKSLVLTCTPQFPKQPIGGLEFLADVTDLQGIVAAYQRELLVRLFQSTSNRAGDASSILRSAGGFLTPWEQRRKLSNPESRSEKEIDTVIRKRVKPLLHEARLLGEEDLRMIGTNEDIPEMLYYLSTLQGGLSWYVARYLARLTGELAKMEA